MPLIQCFPIKNIYFTINRTYSYLIYISFFFLNLLYTFKDCQGPIA